MQGDAIMIPDAILLLEIALSILAIAAVSYMIGYRRGYSRGVCDAD